MNSAIPHFDPVNKVQTSPRRQGAGVMNLKKATELDFTVVSQKTEIPSEFVGDIQDRITFNLKVKNYSGEEKIITPTEVATIEDREGKTLKFRPTELFTKTLDEDTFKVRAGEGKYLTINVPIEEKYLEEVKDFENGAFIEGFLTLEDQNKKTANFAFVSFKGEFATIPSMEKPIYEFDFEKDFPTWWNYNFQKFPWNIFGTLLQTEQGFNEANQTVMKIAGIENYDELNAKKNQAGEPKPIFEKIVFSPNGDNVHDKMMIFFYDDKSGKSSLRSHK